MNFINFHTIQQFVKSQSRNILVFLILIAAVRLALPSVVKWYVNKTLAEIPEYHGQVGDLDLSLWRGTYSIHDIDIVKATDKISAPFFSSRKIVLSVKWQSLFQKAVVTEIDFYSPVINFVYDRNKAKRRVDVDKLWSDVTKKLFPLDISRCEIHEGSIHYRDFYSNPHVDLKIDHVHMLSKKVTNTEDLSKPLVSLVQMEGRAFEESNFLLHAEVAPKKKFATFNIDFKLEPFSLVKINDFARAYGNFDFKEGTLAITAELTAQDGAVIGYIKPLFDHVSVVDLKTVKSPAQLAWEGAIGGLLRLFRNQPTDRFATKIPIYGEFSDPKEDILSALGNILKNAFIRVYTENFEQPITLKDTQRKKTSHIYPKPNSYL